MNGAVRREEDDEALCEFARVRAEGPVEEAEDRRGEEARAETEGEPASRYVDHFGAAQMQGPYHAATSSEALLVD